MKATETRFLDLLKKSPQFIIPVYQRSYSWTLKECQKLWNDILKTGGHDSIDAHFVGSIVYIEKGIYQVSNQSSLLVIDGQQRLTTVTLLMTALASKLNNFSKDKQEPVGGFSPDKIKHYYLFNPLEEGERQYKLLLSETDKDSLISIIKNYDSSEKISSLRIKENFDFFKKLLDDNENEMESICKGLAKLIVVDIALSRDNDNPQLIFESMNSTGKELSQADLIRNFILMDVEPKLQEELYKQYWRPMEKEFGQEAYTTHFDKFIRHYLTVKTGEIPKVSDVYEKFKIYAANSKKSPEKTKTLLEEVRNYSQYFCAMALSLENDSTLKRAFHNLRELKVDVAFPFLLEIYHDYKSNIISKENLVEIVQMVESYVFRRAICNIPTNSMNKTFATFSKGLDKNNYIEAVKARFLLLPSYRRFPNNEEFKRDIQTRDLYNFRSRSYWLRRLENFDRKERVPVDEYTIEHILPQNENLSKEWTNDLGNEWEKDQQIWLHTLGNLTLTGYNSEYGDKSFKEKRDMRGGFKESPLHLNAGLGKLEKWNVEAIQRRASELADKAIEIWAFPEMPDQILDNYRKNKEISRPRYTLEDHPHLSIESNRKLFESFRSCVLRLDTCVTEEVLSLYISYKAETNFVDVIPQANRLKLILNIPYDEIVDTKGIYRDVTNSGHWGIGDVEAVLKSTDELPYVISLVEQSFEHQMGAD